MQKQNHFLKTIFILSSIITLAFFCLRGFADGADILGGTTADAIATIKGSGKTYLYLIEAVISIIAYIKTKNMMYLGGVVVISIFLNIVLHIAGV